MAGYFRLAKKRFPATVTWRREDVLATDVRPENAILAESDGQIYSFDFILIRGK